MFRHVVLFRWTATATDEQKAAVQDNLARLPSIIPELRGYRLGADAGLVDGNWDFAAVADFDDVDGWRVYGANAEHQRIIADHIRPIVGERAAVQYEF